MTIQDVGRRNPSTFLFTSLSEQTNTVLFEEAIREIYVYIGKFNPHDGESAGKFNRTANKSITLCYQLLSN